MKAIPAPLIVRAVASTKQEMVMDASLFPDDVKPSEESG
jgi:hypothetical protein